VDGTRSVAGEGNREGGRRCVHGTKLAGETRKKAVRRRGGAWNSKPRKKGNGIAVVQKGF